MPKSTFQSAAYALLIYNKDGQKLDGTGTLGDLGHAKSQAYSILRLMPQAEYIDVKPFVKGQSLEQANILVRISRQGQSQPQNEAQPAESKKPEQPTERDVLLARLFEIGHLIYFSEHRIDDTTKNASKEEDWRNYWRGQPDEWIARMLKEWQPQYDAIMARLRGETEPLSEVSA